MTPLPFTRLLCKILGLWLLCAVLLTAAPLPAPAGSLTAAGSLSAAGSFSGLIAPTQEIPVKLTFPALTGRVVDDAHALIPETKRDLDRSLEDFETKTGQQVVVVTLPSLQGDAIDDYGYQLGRAWGIGTKGKDNGVLVIVVPSEKKARIEVGYGAEGVLTDALASNIINTVMLPAFRAGNVDQGVIDGTKAVLATLGTPEARPQGPAPPPGGDPLTALQIGGIVIGLIFLLWLSIEHPQLAWFLFRVAMMFASSSSGKGSFRGGGGSFGGGGASGSW